MIYIIDDDKYVLRGFQILLMSEGMESKTFSKVEEFLESWKPIETDILILDMHMPGLGGCNLLDYLKKKNLHPDVIIVTAYDAIESRKCSENYETLAFLTKPVDSELLIGIIKNRKHNFINT